LHSGSDSAPRAEATTVVAEAKPQQIQTIATAEQELRKLRETRIGASPSDRITTLQLFANSEKLPAIIGFRTNVQRSMFLTRS
jgi:hypothetical protein